MYFWLSCLAAGVCIGFMCRICCGPMMRESAAGPRPEQALLRAFWPWILAAAALCGPFVSWRLRHATQRAVRSAGMDGSVWRPERVIALRLLGALLSFAAVSVFAVFAIGAGAATGVYLGCAAAAACLMWSHALLREKASRRRRAMLREFPFLLDMTTLCVEAGLNLNGALAQAATHSPSGHLREELLHMLADMRTGVPRRDALADLADRTDLPAIKQLAAALAQADQLGMSLGPLLRSQSEQRRTERFLRAEKLAMEAPVKMLFPLVFCIFPCTFLIIGFPIAMKLMQAAI